MKQLFRFIMNIRGYWNLHKNYEYDPNTYEFIIQQYETVLCERTKTMSKPTYYARDVVSEIDKFYEDLYEEEVNNLNFKIDMLLERIQDIEQPKTYSSTTINY